MALDCVAVYCGATLGTEKAFQQAAISVGHALASSSRSLVYGGGKKGMMGLVRAAVLEKGGRCTGVIPYAMFAAGGEQPQMSTASEGSPVHEPFPNPTNDKEQTIVVNSMHERKTEMAKRARGFIALPGGYGTFEEVMEAVTWSQLGIHTKPIVLVNVLSFFEPIRLLVRQTIQAGFIRPQNEALLVFVDGPSDVSEHAAFDWGAAALAALDGWEAPKIHVYGYNWTNQIPTPGEADGRQAPLDAT